MSKPTSKMVDAKTQAEWFGRVRRAHQTETAEDYLELIADLIDMQNEARLSDLAQRLGVSHRQQGAESPERRRLYRYPTLSRHFPDGKGRRTGQKMQGTA